MCDVCARPGDYLTAAQYMPLPPTPPGRLWGREGTITGTLLHGGDPVVVQGHIDSVEALTTWARPDGPGYSLTFTVGGHQYTFRADVDLTVVVDGETFDLRDRGA